MSVTVASVIETARDGHELFDEDNIPGQTAMRFLNRYAHRLWQKVIDNDPKRFEKCENFEIATYFADPDPPHPFELPAGYRYIGRKVFKEGTNLENEFAIVDAAEQVYPSVWPSGFIKNGDQLCLIGVERDWTFWTDVRVGFVPLMAELTGPQSNFDPFPDYVRDALEANLAYFMARRIQGKPGAPGLTDFRVDARDAQEDFLLTIANQKSAEVGTIRPVW